MSSIDKAANDLFFKLRNRFPRINLGDEGGNATTIPSEARFFNFDYESDEIKYGNLTASLADGQSLKIFFSTDITQYMDDIEKKKWYSFLQEIRKFAKGHMLGFDIRDITKDVLTKKDLEFVSKQNEAKSQLGESRVLWLRRGKVSEGNLNNVKIHVVHNERMMENPHNRLMKVDRIFLVNESGEKFLLPFKSVAGAKAMANYVARGGTPYDTSGKLITQAVNEMANLRRFATATRRKTFESEDANLVIEAAVTIKESIKRSLFRLANNSRFDENLEDLGKLLAEQDQVQDIKPLFTQNIYNENLDNWISSAARAYQHYKGNIMEQLKESAGSVSSKLKDPNWQLILKDDPSEDRLIITSKYTDGRALLRRVLGTIADRVGPENDDIANWASQIGNDIEDGRASKEDMHIAIHLAKRYQDDLKKIQNDETAKDTLRISAFGQKKDLYGKNKNEAEQFESWVSEVGQEPIEEEEDLDEAGVRNMRNAGRTHNVTKSHLMKFNPNSKKYYKDPTEKSKADDKDEADKLVHDYLAKGGKIKKEDQAFAENEEEMMDEIAMDEEGMEIANEASDEPVDECGCDSSSSDDQYTDYDDTSAGKGSLSISTNTSTDGPKTLSINAMGQKADELANILKMAGMR